MPRPGHKLDLYLVGEEPFANANRANDELFQLLRRRRLIDEAGITLQGAKLVVGGVRRVRVDHASRPTLYSNYRGGFRALCGHCPENLTEAYVRAVGRLRAKNLSQHAKGMGEVECARCGNTTALTEVRCSPPAAFAWGALVLHDAASMALTDDFQTLVSQTLGKTQLIGSRA